MTETTAYTRAEIDRLLADGTIAARTVDGFGLNIVVDPEDAAGFLVAKVYTEEEAANGPTDDAAIVTDVRTGRLFWLIRHEDGPAEADDITDAVRRYEAERGELIGHVGVDSGCVMIGDPCYGADEGTDALMEAIIAARGDISTPRGELGGIAVSTPFGDGVFPVYVHRDSDGRIFRVTVEFD
jgi:hypothetical protein